MFGVLAFVTPSGLIPSQPMITTCLAPRTCALAIAQVAQSTNNIPNFMRSLFDR
jgi:hypothetical protein